MKQAKVYKRLPGRNRSLTRQSSLWLAADHLLAVDRIFFEERYRRFHFGDFQALVIQKTNRWHVITFVLTVLTLVLVAPGWKFWQENEFQLAAISLLPAAICLIGLVVNLILGNSCRCFLQMRVGIHDLPSIRRRRQAEKILERIKPLIRHAQKDIKVTTTESPLPERKVFRHGRSDENTVRSYSGSWHLALNAVLIIDVGFSFIHFFKTGMTLFVVSSLVTIALLLLTVASLVAQRNTALPSSARSATWGVLALYIVATIFGYFYFTFYFLMRQPELLANKPAMYQAMANLQLFEHPFLMVETVIYIIVSVVCVVFSLSGIVHLRRTMKKGETR